MNDKAQIIDSYWNTEEFKLILNLLYKTRLKHNLSQRDIAQKLNMHSSTYNLIENGKQQINLPFLLKFCKEFGIEISFSEQNEQHNGKNITIKNSPNNIINSSNSSIDNRQYYAESPDVLRAQIAVLDERIKEKDAQIKEKDAQINKLLDILKPGK